MHPHDDAELDQLADALEQLAEGPAAHPNDVLRPAGERPCPICGRPMRPFEAEGVTLDGCPQHGVWLDRGELKLLYQRVQLQQSSADKLSWRAERRQIAATTRARMASAATRVAFFSCGG